MKYKVLDTYGVVAKNAKLKNSTKTYLLEPDWRSTDKSLATLLTSRPLN